MSRRHPISLLSTCAARWRISCSRPSTFDCAWVDGAQMAATSMTGSAKQRKWSDMCFLPSVFLKSRPPTASALPFKSHTSARSFGSSLPRKLRQFPRIGKRHMRFPTAREAGIMRSMQIGETRRVRGIAVPSIMYGTAWKEERTQALISKAIACGFRAIDAANQRKHYVEAGVGAAIAAAVASGNVTREQLFVQTKFTYQRGQDHRLPYDPNADPATQVQQSIDSSILHSPSRAYGLGETDWLTWRAMEDAVRAGRVGLLGVSNVSFEQLAM